MKPDNILLDAQGHAHLTDFNVAIHYSEKRLHTSVAGSMAYMAPEMIEKRLASGERKGYTWCIDWWSLGVTMAELLFNRRPFDAKSTDKIRNAILTDPIQFENKDNGKGTTCSPEALGVLYGVLRIS